jgi:hypothetical protein
MSEAEADFRLMRWAYAENIATVLGMVALILGLYAMGAGGWSFWGLLLLFNLNGSSSRETECECDEVECECNEETSRVFCEPHHIVTPKDTHRAV